MSNSDIELYKLSGASAFIEKLPELIQCCIDGPFVQGQMYFVSEICIDLSKYTEAIEILQKINDKFKLSDVGYNLLGYCYNRLDCHADAIESYQKSLLKNPQNISSLRNIAQIEYLSEGKMKVNWTEQFFRHNPNSEEAPRWYSAALWNTGEREEAFEVIKLASKKFPNAIEIKALKADYQKILNSSKKLQ